MSNEEVHELDHLFIGSHPMHHANHDDYIDYGLVLDITYVVMDNPFNDYIQLDTNSNYNEQEIELDEVQDKYNLDM